MKLSMFEGFTSKQVLETTLEEVVGMIREEKRIEVLTEAYRTTGSKSAKMQSPMFAVACRFQDGKGRDNITELTGLSLVDIDHIGPEAIQISKFKIQSDPHTLLCYTTISGRGLRILFRYILEEGLTLEQQLRLYPKAFRMGNEYYEQLLGLSTDLQCKNVTRLSGLAHDAEIYYNPEAEEFSLAQPLLTPPLPLPSDGRGVKYGNSPSDGRGAAGALRGTKKDPATKMERVAEFLARQPLRYDVLSRKMQIMSKDESLKSKDEGQMVNGTREALGTSKKWSNGKWVDLSDRMANTLLHDCNRALGCNISKATFIPMLLSSRIPEVNPLREYILSLPQWDGQTDYIAQVAQMVHVKDTYHNGELKMDNGQFLNPKAQPNSQSSILNFQLETPTSLWHQCFRKWFVAMVASWMKDEAVNHQVLVLIGEQGIFKTTWLDALMPPELAQYRSKQSGTRYLDKDEQLRATEFGLINMDEIDRMTEAELNALKSLITATDVNVRSPYAYGKERRLRVASYVASGNKERFLTDMTGNRRWLPFRVESIESPFEHPMPYEGMYAQAWHLVQEGFNYWFDLQEIRQLSSHVEEFAVETNEQQLLPVYFEPCPAGTPGAQFLTVAEISAKLSYYGNIHRPMDVRQLGALLRKMGYEAKRVGHNSTRGYIVLEKTAENISAMRKLNASTE